MQCMRPECVEIEWEQMYAKSALLALFAVAFALWSSEHIKRADVLFRFYRVAEIKCRPNDPSRDRIVWKRNYLLATVFVDYQRVKTDRRFEICIRSKWVEW